MVAVIPMGHPPVRLKYGLERSSGQPPPSDTSRMSGVPALPVPVVEYAWMKEMPLVNVPPA
jgi:hypothetical protein